VAAQGDPPGQRVEGAPRRDGTFEEETEAARAAARAASGFDPYSFTIAFRASSSRDWGGVHLLTFGANQHRIPLAAIAAGLAIAVVAAAGSQYARHWRAYPRTR